VTFLNLDYKVGVLDNTFAGKKENSELFVDNSNYTFLKILNIVKLSLIKLKTY
jgi:hypothetical protein